MTNYHDYAAFDFLEDAFFLDTHRRPTAETESFWIGLLRDRPELSDSYQEAVKIFNGIKSGFEYRVDSVSAEHVNRSFQELDKRLEVHPAQPIGRRRYWTRVALAFTIAMVIGSGAYQLYQEKFRPISRSFSTGNAEQLISTLPGGTEVKLNANSKLYYFPTEWTSNGKREVWLDGEAFFVVSERTDKSKFIVHAGEMDISVIGTEFNVRNRNGKSEIMLAEGKVELDIRDHQMSMEPGDLVTFSAKQRQIESTKVQPVEYSAWKDGMTVFNDKFSVVAKELETIHGIEIVLDNQALAERQIQLSAPNNSLDQILNTLQLLYPHEFNFEMRKGKLIILEN